jgi:RES domain-containing protein
LWRISTFTSLSGEGGLLAPGRWHSRGRAVVYLSDHPALALLETIVRLQVDPDNLPDDYRILRIEAADDVPIETVDKAKLAGDWQADLARTRRLGDEWLASKRTALLRVPSAIVPSAFNFLLNPSHTDGEKISVIDAVKMAFDPRLFR